VVKQQVTILGATGSIGVNTLNVISQHRDRFQVFALTAHKNVELLLSQILTFQPRYGVVLDDLRADWLASQLQTAGSETEVMVGVEALDMVAAHPDCDAVMAAIVGAAGLSSTLAAAEAGKRVLLANKEALVMSGELFMKAAADGGAELLPIDSEHNAVFQCLGGARHSHAERIVLTASGGPFRDTPLADLADVTPDQACAHPNWAMGRKISVDSATMMNKGLELIEASFLFELPLSQIEVVIHRESIVHSLVTFSDGSCIAQMGNPDMRTPIAHGLGWPDRIQSGVAPLDIINLGKLHFEPADLDRFPSLNLARQAAAEGQGAIIVLNAANEVAVQCFLDELIRFTDIPLVIEKTLEQTSIREVHTIAEVVAVDEEARSASRILAAEIN